MATGQATRAPAGNRDWERKPAGLTFGQRALLVMGIAALGYPGFICLEGSVRNRPPVAYSSEQASVMSNGALNLHGSEASAFMPREGAEASSKGRSDAFAPSSAKKLRPLGRGGSQLPVPVCKVDGNFKPTMNTMPKRVE